MKHLLTLSIGPVQEFIAAARRTNDLSAGSDLLVALTQAAAKSLEEEIGPVAQGDSEFGLIFPADSGKPGANKILCALPDAVDPVAAAERAKRAVRAALAACWDEALPKISGKYRINNELARAQIDSFPEVYAAWLPYGTGNYPTVRATLGRLLAARKALRDFEPPPSGLAPGAVHGKSRLDPAYECVLLEQPTQFARDATDNGDYKRRNPLDIRRTENPDAISLLKRYLGGEKSSAPSTNALARRNWDPSYQEKGWILDDPPEKYPYYAVLVADGDKMGEKLDDIGEPALHRAFSGKLSEFADAAKQIVESRRGYPVYAGGDDIVALLPANKAIACARELAYEFARCVDGTLSAGVAIVHYLQPLSRSLQQAREAEKKAKENDRESLCLALHTRGGQPLYVARKWDAWPEFERRVGQFEAGQITRGVAYELRELAREFINANVPAGVLQSEVERIWKRKESIAGENADLPRIGSSPGDLQGFADLLTAARFLTAKGDE